MTVGLFSGNLEAEAARGPAAVLRNQTEAQDRGRLLASVSGSSLRRLGSGDQGRPCPEPLHTPESHAHRRPVLSCMASRAARDRTPCPLTNVSASVCLHLIVNE